MAATIVAGVGVLASAAGTALSIKSSSDAAGKSQELMTEQNAKQQTLINQATAAQQKQQKEKANAEAVLQAKVASMARQSSSGTPNSSLLTSPLAALTGTRGVSESIYGSSGSGKTLIGM